MSLVNYHDISLDLELSLGARVKVAYKTKVIRTREGDEERIGEWQDALRTFDIAPALRDQVDLDYLIAFFRGRLGPSFAFKVRDPLDYTADIEQFGVGDGVTTTFQLVKGYASGNHRTIRPILLPDVPVAVYINHVLVSSGLYTCDPLSGLVSFGSPPHRGAVVSWSGTFRVPVRFETMQLYISFAMYQRFDAHIMLVEERAAFDTTFILAEAEPADFEEAIFPTMFSEGSESGPQYDAVVSVGSSGVNQRTGQFQAPRVCFRVDQSVRSLEEMRELLTFFHARRGRLVGFRALDFTDYHAVDALLGTGNGSVRVFQLTKYYMLGGFSQGRAIVKPSIPVAIYVDGVLMNDVRVVETSQGTEVFSGDGTGPHHVTVDGSNGVVIFATAPPLGSLLQWTGAFYVPVRFDTDELDISLEGFDVQTWSQIQLLEIPTMMQPITLTRV